MAEDSLSSLKVMMEEMKTVESDIAQSEEELKKMEEQLKLEEKNEKKLTFDNFNAQQQLMATTENIASISDKFQSNGRVLRVLIQQLSGINTSIVETEAKIEKVQSLNKKYENRRMAYKDQVQVIDANIQENTEKLLTDLQTQIDKLLETKKKLEGKDILTKLIASGEALKTVEAQQKAVIRSAGDKKLHIENLMAEVEKKKAIIKQIQEEMTIAQAAHETRMQQFKDKEEALETLRDLADLNFDLEDDFPMTEQGA